MNVDVARALQPYVRGCVHYRFPYFEDDDKIVANFSYSYTTLEDEVLTEVGRAAFESSGVYDPHARVKDDASRAEFRRLAFVAPAQSFAAIERDLRELLDAPESHFTCVHFECAGDEQVYLFPHLISTLSLWRQLQKNFQDDLRAVVPAVLLTRGKHAAIYVDGVRVTSYEHFVQLASDPVPYTLRPSVAQFKIDPHPVCARYKPHPLLRTYSRALYRTEYVPDDNEDDALLVGERVALVSINDEQILLFFQNRFGDASALNVSTGKAWWEHGTAKAPFQFCSKPPADVLKVYEAASYDCLIYKLTPSCTIANSGFHGNLCSERVFGKHGGARASDEDLRALLPTAEQHGLRLCERRGHRRWLVFEVEMPAADDADSLDDDALLSSDDGNPFVAREAAEASEDNEPQAEASASEAVNAFWAFVLAAGYYEAREPLRLEVVTPLTMRANYWLSATQLALLKEAARAFNASRDDCEPLVNVRDDLPLNARALALPPPTAELAVCSYKGSLIDECAYEYTGVWPDAVREFLLPNQFGELVSRTRDELVYHFADGGYWQLRLVYYNEERMLVDVGEERGQWLCWLSRAGPKLKRVLNPVRSLSFERDLASSLVGSNGLVRFDADGRVYGVPERYSYSQELKRAVAPLSALDVHVTEHARAERFTASAIAVNLANGQRVTAALNCTLLRGDTGAGKTHALVQLIKRFVAEGGKALVLAPRVGLLEQCTAKLKEAFGGDGQLVQFYKASAAAVASARVVCCTPHSLHKMVSETDENAFVYLGRPTPLLLAVDEVCTTFLEDTQSVKVLRPENFEPWFGLLLCERVTQLVLLDANLPPVVVANVLRRLHWTRKERLRLPEQQRVEVHVHRATFSNVRNHRREAHVYTSNYGAGSEQLKERVAELLRAGERVSIFVSRLAELESLREYFALPAAKVLEISSKQKPEDWSNLPQTILAQDVRLVIYTTAGSAGVDIAWYEEFLGIVMEQCKIKIVAAIGVEEDFLSLLQVYQAISRVRYCEQVLLAMPAPRGVWELGEGEQALRSLRLPRLLTDLRRAELTTRAVAARVDPALAGRQVQVPAPAARRHPALRDFNDSLPRAVAQRDQLLHTFTPNPGWLAAVNAARGAEFVVVQQPTPFIESFVLGRVYRYLEELRSTYLVALLTRVGYEVRLHRTPPSKEQRRELQKRSMTADVRAVMRGQLQGEAEVPQWEQLGLPALSEDEQQNKQLCDQLKRLARQPHVFKIMDVAAYLQQQQLGADVAQWRTALHRVARRYANSAEQQRFAAQLERRSLGALPASSDAAVAFDEGSAEVLLWGVYLYCALQLAGARNQLTVESVSAATPAPAQLPSLRLLLGDQYLVRLVPVEEWLQEWHALHKDDKRKTIVYENKTKRSSGKLRQWSPYTAVVRSLYASSATSSHRSGVQFAGNELKWVTELFGRWKAHNVQNLSGPTQNAEVFIPLAQVSTQLARASQMTLDDSAILGEFAFDTSHVARKKRKLQKN